MLSIIKAVVLRTADTNTRVRKKSVEIINQLWNNEDSLKSAVIRENEDQAISMMIASVLTDGSL